MMRTLSTLALLMTIVANTGAQEPAADAKKPAMKYSVYAPACRLGYTLVAATNDLRELSQAVATAQKTNETLTIVADAHDLKDLRTKTPTRYEIFRVGLRCGNVFPMGVVYEKSWADELAKLGGSRTFIVASY